MGRLKDNGCLLIFAVVAVLAALWFSIVVLALEAYYVVRGLPH